MAPWLGGIQHHEEHVCALAHSNDLMKEEGSRGGEVGLHMSGLVASSTMRSMSALLHTALT